MDEGCQERPGSSREFGAAGRLQVVARWECSDGAEIRVVRWELRGGARDLMHWARGQAFAPDAEAEPEETWAAGVALERRAGPSARWDTVRRQELTGRDPRLFAARLNGWEAGLRDRAQRLARKQAPQ
ncbi:MAG TPA: hypothetical protein VM536_15975 [Chloroflexia bacterium]|nr:hypothetical protein [Chloroflexia bacterium]